MKSFTKWTVLRLAVTLSLGGALFLVYPGDAAALTGAEGTTVILTCPDGRFTAIPDATGRFSFASVPEGTCRLSVTAPASTAQGEVTAPRDAASGLPTGKRMHKPMLLMISIDGMPEASKTMAIDDWRQNSVSLTTKGKPKQYTGHVTLMK